MEIVYGLILFALVATFVLYPLLGNRRASSPGEDPVIADLEARREAKYREIRDTQLDHAAGKLSERDFKTQEAALRAEAVEILHQLDAARERRGKQTKVPSP